MFKLKGRHCRDLVSLSSILKNEVKCKMSTQMELWLCYRLNLYHLMRKHRSLTKQVEHAVPSYHRSLHYYMNFTFLFQQQASINQKKSFATFIANGASKNEKLHTECNNHKNGKCIGNTTHSYHMTWHFMADTYLTFFHIYFQKCNIWVLHREFFEFRSNHFARSTPRQI